MNANDIVDAILALENPSTDDLRMIQLCVSTMLRSSTVAQAASFKLGQRIRFGRPNGQQHYGVIRKINAASLKVDGEDGRKWKVHPSLAHAA